MPENLLPFLFALLLLAVSTVAGILPIKKIIQMREAKHELKQGSAGWIRALSGWAFVAFWIMATWFFATILGDWSSSGDLQGAIARSGHRLAILLEIAAALADD